MALEWRGEMAQRHGGALLKTAQMRSGHHADALDLVQDTFERALRQGPSMNSDEEVGRWLMVVLRNRFVDHCRFLATRTSGSVDIDLLAAPEPDPDPWWLDVDPALVNAMVTRLSTRLRDALNLRVAGLSLREIALRHSITVSTAGTRIHRARRALRTLIERELATHAA